MFNTSSISSSYIKATQGYISSLTVDEFQIGTGYGTHLLGDIQVSSVSTLALITNTLVGDQVNVVAGTGIGMGAPQNLSMWAGTYPYFLLGGGSAPTPNFYIAGSNSNVGILTSNPLTPLDVAGNGRFQGLSTLSLTTGTINYSVAFV
jgi:hypothetical protein